MSPASPAQLNTTEVGRETVNAMFSQSRKEMVDVPRLACATTGNAEGTCSVNAEASAAGI